VKGWNGKTWGGLEDAKFQLSYLDLDRLLGVQENAQLMDVIAKWAAACPKKEDVPVQGDKHQYLFPAGRRWWLDGAEWEWAGCGGDVGEVFLILLVRQVRKLLTTMDTHYLKKLSGVQSEDTKWTFWVDKQVRDYC
jgi:hypothetical protein